MRGQAHRASHRRGTDPASLRRIRADRGDRSHGLSCPDDRIAARGNDHAFCQYVRRQALVCGSTRQPRHNSFPRFHPHRDETDGNDSFALK